LLERKKKKRHLQGLKGEEKLDGMRAESRVLRGKEMTANHENVPVRQEKRGEKGKTWEKGLPKCDMSH